MIKLEYSFHITNETNKMVYENHKRSIDNNNINNIVNSIKSTLDILNANSKEWMPLQVSIKQIIKFCYDEFVSKASVIKLLNEITKNWSKNCQIHFIKKIEDIYNTGICLDGGFEDLKKYNNNLNKEQIIILKENIGKKHTLDLIKETTGTDTAILINSKAKRIIREHTKIVNEKDLSKYYTVIEACPKEVIVYDSHLTDEPRSFQIKWDSKLSLRTFKTGGEVGGGNINEIESQLEDAGYCPNPRYLKGTVSSIISAFIKNNLAIIKKDVEYPGFFYDDADEKILSIKYDLNIPSKKELKSATDLLEELVKHFEYSEDKLATCLKWGWISPFNFIKKQKGEFLPWLVLDGVAGTGKTALGRIILLLWEEANEKNDMGGSSFDTVARVGSRISQSTFPVLINEPLGTFQNGAVVDMLKSAIERTTARGKYINNRYKYIPSLAPLMFTTNQSLPNLDAIARRTLKVTFHYNERKNEEDRQNFEKEFILNQLEISPINKLKNISHFFANEIIQDPKLLKENWQTCANMILQRLYADIDKEMPEWLKKFVRNISMEEFDSDQREDIRMFMIDQINQHKNRIKIYNERGFEEKEETLYSEDLKNSNDFRDRVWNVINERLIAWMVLVETNNKKYVCFTQGLKKELNKETEVCQSLQSISELLGWKYQAVRLNKGANPTKVMKIEFNKFISFLYPDIEMKLN